MAERIQCRWCGHDRAANGGPSPHCTAGWKCAHAKPCPSCDAPPGHKHSEACTNGVDLPDAAKLCDLWFAEWELILPPDARESFRDDLLPSVRNAGVAMGGELSSERIEQLAKEAGFGFFGQWHLWQGDTTSLQQFARVVAAHVSGVKADAPHDPLLQAAEQFVASCKDGNVADLIDYYEDIFTEALGVMASDDASSCPQSPLEQKEGPA